MAANRRLDSCHVKRSTNEIALFSHRVCEDFWPSKFKFALQVTMIGHRSTQKIYINIQFFLSKCNRGLSIIKGLAICARISEVNVIF